MFHCRSLVKLNTVFMQYEKYLFFFFFFLRAAPVIFGSSQARGLMGATAAGLHHSHSNVRSQWHLRPTPQLMQHWILNH